MRGRGLKLHNEYASQFGELFEDTPKAVFAAIAYSFASNGGSEDRQTAIDHFLHEWSVLHIQGIVPQKPKRREP